MKTTGINIVYSTVCIYIYIEIKDVPPPINNIDSVVKKIQKDKNQKTCPYPKTQKNKYAEMKKKAQKKLKCLGGKLS